MKQYETLLKEAAHREDEEVANTFDHESARAQFIMNISTEFPVKSTRLLRLAVIATAVAICGLIAAGIYVATAASGPELEPKWIQVGNADSRTLKFDDGTKVRFNENSTGRVTQIAAHAGEVTLENGRVDLKVTHTQSTDWHVLAGPYHVAVTGTRFEVQWNPQVSQLKVNVFEGSVLVTGPMIESGHAVIANRSLSANPSTSNVQLTSLNDTRDTDLPNQSVPGKNTVFEKKNASARSEEIVAIDDNPLRTDKTKTIQVSQAWLSYAQAGDYAKVSKYITTYGLQRVLSGAKPASYLLLGNVARQARDFTTAQKVYERLRRDYPGSGHAATAALYLGRMNFDQQRQYAAAVKWFNIYLSEQKSGTLHRETLGRLMEAQYKSNMRAEARQTAKQYLVQYPDGPHSVRAKELSGQ